MEKSSEYMLAFRGLGRGIHTLSFTIDERFFKKYKTLENTVGSLQTEITIDKKDSFLTIQIKLKGSVKAVCDRCLGELDLPISGELEIYAKEYAKAEGNGDDFLILSPSDDYIDLGDLIYQTYLLNYPIRVVHKEGECDKEMEGLLDKYVINESKNSIDPRWNELKKLINN